MVVVFIGLNLARAQQSGRIPVVAIVIQLLIAVGLVARDRLAWQWGRLIPMLFAVLMAVIAVTAVGRRPDWWMALPVLFLVPAVVVVISLGRTSARAWFRLVCPTCGGIRAKAADFLFRRARCSTCGTVW
jgi:hypothetical protein